MVWPVILSASRGSGDEAGGIGRPLQWPPGLSVHETERIAGGINQRRRGVHACANVYLARPSKNV
jgi:hypothetical protein